jgi:hypothetical protein
VTFLAHFCAPPNIVKYSGDTNPSVRLEDFHLACQEGGANDDAFIIQYLPLYLAKNARAWVEHLLVDCVHLWVNLKCIFVGNFQGTYLHPGNS